MHIVITRPKEDSLYLIENLIRLGHTVTHLPVIKIEKLETEKINLLNYQAVIFTIEQMLPAIGQGVIALQCKKKDIKTLNILKNINDKDTYYCIQAERALLEAIGGDCDTAIGGLAKLSNNEIFLKSELFSNDGKKKFQSQSSGHFKEAKEIGYKVGKELLKKAGSDFTPQGN